VELVSSQPPDDFPLPAIKLLFRMEGRKAGVSRTNRLIKIKMVAGSRGKNIRALLPADTYYSDG